MTRPVDALKQARKAWARSLIRRAPDPPTYGSHEWVQLPNNDPRKVAACVRAAECWATEGDDLVASLLNEIEATRRANKAAADTDYVTNARQHKREWRHLRPVPPPTQQPRDLYDIGRDTTQQGNAS